MWACFISGVKSFLEGEAVVVDVDILVLDAMF
jgi:hypothetical protein